jgi:hypothetical protein
MSSRRPDLTRRQGHGTSEQAIRHGYAWNEGSRRSPGRLLPISSQMLRESDARAKLARQTVQSERPGLPAEVFAFCAVRTAFATRGCERGGLAGWAS